MNVPLELSTFRSANISILFNFCTVIDGFGVYVPATIQSFPALSLGVDMSLARTVNGYSSECWGTMVFPGSDGTKPSLNKLCGTTPSDRLTIKSPL